MTEPPAGWIQTTLGAICDHPQYGWTTSARRDALKTTALRFLRTTDITRGRLDWEAVPYCKDEPPRPEQYLLAPGDIVISRAGSIGFSYHLIDVEPAVFASYLIRFRPSRLVDDRYVAYFLQSPRYWQQVRGAAAGIALANINAKKLAAIELPLAPRAEQERIVAAIEEQFSRLDAGVAALERVIGPLTNTQGGRVTQLRSSILATAFSGKLVPRDPSDESASTLFERIADERASSNGHKPARVRSPRRKRASA
jgi:type I restriction enzyme S subunit